MVKVEMLNNTLKQIPALDKFVQGWAIFSPRITGLLGVDKIGSQSSQIPFSYIFLGLWQNNSSDIP